MTKDEHVSENVVRPRDQPKQQSVRIDTTDRRPASVGTNHYRCANCTMIKTDVASGQSPRDYAGDA